MPVVASDLSIVLSGGSNNTLPFESIGGDPSAFPVKTNQNNLFDDVTIEETTTGLKDFRCLYVFNDNVEDDLYDTVISLTSISPETQLFIGTTTENEIQRIVTDGAITGGNFVITYDNSPELTVVWDSDPDIWAANLKSQLQTITILQGITVEVAESGDSTIFTLTFTGNGVNRSHPTPELIANNLTGSPSIVFSTVLEGGPINQVPQKLDFDTQTPFNVQFSTSVSIGLLQASDGVPIWVSRTVPPGASNAVNDGFQLSIVGESEAP